MKRNILVCGLISGTILSVMMVASIAYCYAVQNFEGSMVVGYAAMILAFSLIFVGIKNFRDKYNGGSVNFGTAFKIGAYITLIASTMYVLAWLFDYYLFVPDFMDVYSLKMISQTKESGATEQEILDKTAEMASFKEMYKNPFFIILITYAEVAPIGLVISLISAWILKKK